MAAVEAAAADTPADRNRAVDTWRVAALFVVVFGHWLAASVWVQPDGSVTVLNTLEWLPHAAWVTWFFQVMPIFFFVGGFANAAALEKRRVNLSSWLIRRFRRLYAPTVPVIVVWAVLALILRQVVDDGLLYSGVLNATIPLWFLAVYLILVGLAPVTHRMWHRWGMASVAVLVAGAVAVDIATRVFGVDRVEWLNLVFVWGAVHQLGYWWYTRETSDTRVSPASALVLAPIGLIGLIAVTQAGIYPVSMLDIPGSTLDNVTPPTAAVMLLALTQIGIIVATAPFVERLALRQRVWKLVVAISMVMMTIYVWHLSALSLVVAAGTFLFDGITMSIEPGSVLWWGTRWIFFVVLIATTAALLVPFARFETDTDRSPTDAPVPLVIAGMSGGVAALIATSYIYLVDRNAHIRWWIPAVAVVVAVAMGAYPSRWKPSRFRSGQR